MAPDVNDKDPASTDGPASEGRAVDPGEGQSSPEDQTAEQATGQAVDQSTDQATEQATEQAFFDAGETAVAPVDDEIDPELLQLPQRPRRRRHPVISVIVIALSLYLMYFVRDDFIFFLQPAEPVDVGEAAAALTAGKLSPNTHVTLSGAPDRKHALIMEGRFGGYDSFFRLLQTSNKLFVLKHRERRATDSVVTATHTGQLVRFGSLPNHEGLRDYFAKTMTIPHDLDFHAVARAKTRKTTPAVVEDRDGIQIQLDPESVVWVNVVFPDEWLIQLSKRTFKTAEEAAKALISMELKLPLAQDDERSETFWRFVVHAEADQVPLLMARFKDQDKKGSVVRRQLSYSARWSQLSVEGDDLIIDAADPSFPTRYRVSPGPSGAQELSAARPGPVSVPKEGVLFITTSSPFSIAPDALVLLADHAPGDYWYYALLYAVLVVFILLNAVALFRRWRERGAAANG